MKEGSSVSFACRRMTLYLGPGAREFLALVTGAWRGHTPEGRGRVEDESKAEGTPLSRPCVCPNEEGLEVDVLDMVQKTPGHNLVSFFSVSFVLAEEMILEQSVLYPLSQEGSRPTMGRRNLRLFTKIGESGFTFGLSFQSLPIGTCPALPFF
jgi:hypothetical protein